MNNLPGILGAIALSIAIFTIIREFICWYFKVNERVQLQKDVLTELMKMNEAVRVDIENKVMHRWVTDPNTTVDVDKL